MTDETPFLTTREALMEIRADVKTLTMKLDGFDPEDHEVRLRRLESSGFRLQGVWASLGILAGLCAGLAGLAVGISQAL